MLMVSYGAGGATDFQARIVTMTAGNEDALGMPIAIINKPGAGGRVGWNWFATQAEKDGYTLAAYNIPHFIAQSIKGGVQYSADSFEPIANWGADPAVFIVGLEDGLLPYRRGAVTGAAEEEATDLAEERRLFYVGITRAGRRLFLSHARRRRLYGRTLRLPPSPFLADLQHVLRIVQEKRPRRKKGDQGGPEQLRLF